MEKDMREIREYNDHGEEIKLKLLEKVTDLDWENKLTTLAYNVTRNHGTEMPFSTPENYQPGIYRCICCNNALFESNKKYNSYTGWPSFFQAIAAENVKYVKDESLRELRMEVQCNLCDAHLGHVFDDGPEPTFLRYCMNGSALNFIKK
jgi:peptide-methionine (R)-S-oxide reductase